MEDKSSVIRKATIEEIITANKNSDFNISLEFFPPKTDVGVSSLYKTIQALMEFNPLFVDFTWVCACASLFFVTSC